MARILSRIQRSTEPAELLRYACTNAGGILADARGEDECVEPLECGCQHAGVEADPIGEIVGRQFGLWVLTGLEYAHVVADAGESLQAAITIKEILYGRRGHALLGHQIQHDSGIELARTRSHREPVQRGETHGALDTPPALQRTH